MITLKQIQLKIAEAIKHSGFTQTELAKRLNVSQQTISCYVHGTKMPALDTFANLCAVLDIEPADILCVTEYDGNGVNKAVGGNLSKTPSTNATKESELLNCYRQLSPYLQGVALNAVRGWANAAPNGATGNAQKKK